MITSTHKLALVVPTKDRPDDLRKLLMSVSAQTRIPDQIIVVDGSEHVVDAVLGEFPKLKVDYVRVFPPSLAKQRNAGMARLRGEITLAGYLDDDIVLEPEAVECMLGFWDACSPEYGGAAFNIVNKPLPGRLGLKQIFGIDHREPGRVLASGFPSSICSVQSDLDTDWLYGGATVWRRDVIARFPYDEWFVGTGFMEDIDYSFNVRSSYRLRVVAAARLAHFSRPVRSDRQRLLGTWQVVNRMYFVRKYRNRGASLAAAWWACAGLLILNLGLGLLRKDGDHARRALGNLVGIVSELAGRKTRLGGHLK